MALSEFELIRRYFGQVGASRDDVLLGVGDDAALVDTGGAEALALCVDTLVAGVHFTDDAPADSVGHKALAVNLSDLAAMGARPAFGLLALTLPGAEPGWLEDFRRGLHALAESHQVALVGGDTTRGGLAVSVTLAGFVPPALALRRDGARAGDAIYVTGSLGDAAAGLRFWLAGRGARDSQVAALVERLHRPVPRVAVGCGLRGIASAAIDVSDGLGADLGHLLARSGVGGRLDLARLPLSPALRQSCEPAEALAFALGGGDDYELCFTVPPAQEGSLAALSERTGVALTRIGWIEPEPGLRTAGAEGPLPLAGFDHFAAAGGS